MIMVRLIKNNFRLITMSTYIVDAIRTPIGNFGGTLKRYQN